MRLLLVLALLVASASALAQRSPPPVAISAEDQALVDRAARRGKLIYAYDQAAWHGTDDAIAKAPDLGPKIGGWVVDGPPEATEFLFFDKDPASPHMLYIARFRDNKLIDGHALSDTDDRTISSSRLKLIAALNTARDAARAARIGNCSDKPFNTVVLPPETPGGPTLVYFLTPQATNDAIPMGGHYLIEVATDGTAGAPVPFAKSCIALPTNQANSAAMWITHLLTPVPTEIHVFTSLSARLPLFVGTTQNQLLWSVNGTEIVATGKLDDKN
ncbi:MAG: hypothetical protein K2Y20_02985 [Sphingomonas sp.]|nr:hypothetical protein [Sphingomonas sp.]